MEKGSAHSNRQLAEPAGEREPYLQVHLSEEGNLIQQGGKEGESGEDLNLKEKIRQDPPPPWGRAHGKFKKPVAEGINKRTVTQFDKKGLERQTGHSAWVLQAMLGVCLDAKCRGAFGVGAPEQRDSMTWFGVFSFPFSFFLFTATPAA